MNTSPVPSPDCREKIAALRAHRALAIAEAGGILSARKTEALPQFIDTTVSEALVLGLLLQGVRIFVAVFGHGSTEIAEVLRIYQEAGLLKVYPVRSELEASHAATALRWVTGEKAAVVTSIGPGALHALAASLTPASNGLGIWYLMGDETTEDEGPNMQQIPGRGQAAFLKQFSAVGQVYQLHTPLALPTALRNGLATVDHPHRGQPFYLLLPMNIQPVRLHQLNLDELPIANKDMLLSSLGAPSNDHLYHQAADAIERANRVLVRLGGGSRDAGSEISEFLALADAVAIQAPVVLGVVPYENPRNMTVAGSKGSLCGNYAMENADLLVVIGSRAVCQSDCSRTGYPSVDHVININTDLGDALHYNKTIALWGDAAATLRRLNEVLRGRGLAPQSLTSNWLAECTTQRQAWTVFKATRYRQPTLFDPVWKREVLTQPAAIKAALDWARANQAVSFFDAGDVQANGFQIAENERFGQTFTDGGASYMGFAASAILATALSEQPFYALAFCGDGSFTMNPQILIDGVEHGALGCILVLDNRRMAAISGLQEAQYGRDFATSDSVQVDYVAWAKAIKGIHAVHGGYSTESLISALNQAISYPGLSLIHLPVYYGPDELGGMGVFGRWNVGNWSEATQELRHEIGI